MDTTSTTDSSGAAPEGSRKRPRLGSRALTIAIDDSTHREPPPKAPEAVAAATLQFAWWRQISCAPSATLGASTVLSGPTFARITADDANAAQPPDRTDITPRTRLSHMLGRGPVLAPLAAEPDERQLSNPASTTTSPSNVNAFIGLQVLSASAAGAKRARRATSAVSSPFVGGRHPASNPFSSRNAPAFRYACVCTHAHGRTRANEDRYTVVANLLGQRANTFYAVFDGHGGAKAAEWAVSQLVQQFEDAWEHAQQQAQPLSERESQGQMQATALDAAAESERVRECLRRAFIATDEAFLRHVAATAEAFLPSSHTPAPTGTENDVNALRENDATSTAIGATAPIQESSASVSCTVSDGVALTGTGDVSATDSELPSGNPVSGLHTSGSRSDSMPRARVRPKVNPFASSARRAVDAGNVSESVLPFQLLSKPLSEEEYASDATATRNPGASASALILPYQLTSTESPASPFGQGEYEGCTALVVVAFGYTLYIAHVGDSRALYVTRKADWRWLTTDHTTAVPAERSRVIACGGSIDGDGRINGMLQITRSLGDAKLKRVGLSAVPDVGVLELDPHQDALVVLATDGIWDVLSAEAVVKVVRDSVVAVMPADASPSMQSPQGQPPSAAFTPHVQAGERSRSATDLLGDAASVFFKDMSRDETPASSSITGAAASVPVPRTGSDAGIYTTQSPVAAAAADSLARFAEPKVIAERIVAEARLAGALDDATVMVVDATRPAGIAASASLQSLDTSAPSPSVLLA